MYTKPFNHKDLILKWLSQRNMDTVLAERIPNLGITAFQEDGRPIGCAFLRMVEGDNAMLEGLIADPEVSPQDREDMSHLLASELIKIAKGLKIKQILAFSTHGTTIMRANRHGFKELPYTMIALDLL